MDKNGIEMKKFFKKLNFTILNENMWNHVRSEHPESDSVFYRANTYNKIHRRCPVMNSNDVNRADPPTRQITRINTPSREEIFAKYTFKLNKRCKKSD